MSARSPIKDVSAIADAEEALFAAAEVGDAHRVAQLLATFQASDVPQYLESLATRGHACPAMDCGRESVRPCHPEAIMCRGENMH